MIHRIHGKPPVPESKFEKAQREARVTQPTTDRPDAQPKKERYATGLTGAAYNLLRSIEIGDRANVHGWSVALREELDAYLAGADRPPEPPCPCGDDTCADRPPEPPTRHVHEWPTLPNPSCGIEGCPGAEDDDWHEHCVRCGGINPFSLYGDDARERADRPPEPPTLDVERLARALAAWWIADRPLIPFGASMDSWEVHLNDARLIAAKYAEDRHE